MSPPYDPFLADAKRFHEETQEMYKKDNKQQEALRLQFTTNPDGLRRRLEDIEARALGFKYDEMNVVVNIQTNQPVKESDVKLLNKNIEEAMLKSEHELFAEFEMQYKDGFIYPVDWKNKKVEKARD
jgi:hypothetical protein|tara:strand:+ start:16 stop:396 length:381 start_codon:yes stop_codon:yes gene_type:complete